MKDSFEKLVKVIYHLRSEKGCIHDRTKTIDEVKQELVKEAQEVVDAIDKKDFEEVKEELGDLLWDTLTIIQLCNEKGYFTEKEVFDAAREKFIRRHPHVFGNEKAETIEEVHKLWTRVKEQEKLEKLKSKK